MTSSTRVPVRSMPATGPSRLVDESPGASDPHPDTVLAGERLADLQRLQAEYVNYKRRVDRDRAVVQERAAQSVIEALLPVLDDIPPRGSTAT